MSLLVAFLAACALLLVVFRGLSSPHAGLPASVRLALGILVTFGVALGMLWVSCNAWGLLAAAAAAAVGSTALAGEGLLPLTAALGRLRFPVYLLAVATLAALVSLCVPITTFLTSPGEISIHLGYLLAVNARDAMVFVYAAAALYALVVTPRMKTALTLFALTALALGLGYSYALPFGYPKMAGLTFEQLPISTGARALRVVVDMAVLVALGLIARVALTRLGARPLVIGILLIDLSLGAAAVVSVRRDEVRGGAGGPAAPARLASQPLRFSPTQRNVLIVFLDRFMGSYVEPTLASDPGLAARLEGFTWYPRTVSAGENSIAGVHPMFGGYDYLPVAMNARGTPLRDQSVEAFSILPYNFSRRGYRVNVVDPRGLGFTMAGDCGFLRMPGVTCTHIPASVVHRRARQMGFSLGALSRANYAQLLTLLGAMRSSPYAAKEVLHQRGPWKPFLDHSAGTTFTAWAELDAFPELTMTRSAEPNLDIVSNILPHEPYFLGENCLPQREGLRLSDGEVRRRGHSSLFSLQHAVTARCTLLAVARYLDFLRTAGVYANTKIVIVSDHGIVGPVKDESTRAVAGGTQDNIFVRTRPLLLVKEVGATGPLRVSEAFLPNAEVPRIVCEEIGGCVNPYLDDRPIDTAGRDDPFYVSLVPWQFTKQNLDSFVIEHQLVLRGKDPFDVKGWSAIQ